MSEYQPRVIHGLIRLIAIFRSSTSMYYSARDIFDRLARYSRTDRRDWSERDILAWTNVTPQVLRGVVALSAQISCLTDKCLDCYLGRLMEIRPVQPDAKIEQEFEAQENEPLGIPIMRAWGRRREGCNFETPDQHLPPSWSELQRISRGFWFIQLFYEFKITVTRACLNAPDYYLRDERMQDCIGFMSTEPGPPPYLQEIFTVADYLGELGEAAVATAQTHTRLHCSATGQWRFPSVTTRNWSPSGVTQPDALEVWGLKSAAPYYYVWRQLSTCQSPMKRMPFRPFRSLGFAIWDQARMAAFGVMNSVDEERRQARVNQIDLTKLNRRIITPGIPGPAPPPARSDQKPWYFYAYTWRSLLSDSEAHQAGLDQLNRGEQMVL